MAMDLSPNLKNYKSAAILKDGTTLNIRAIQPADVDELISFVGRLSQRTSFLRFRHYLQQLSVDEARLLVNVDYDNTFALIALVGEDASERIVAIARYTRLPAADHATTSFVVEDAFQGRGIGTAIMEQLAEVAREKGLAYLEGEAIAEAPQPLKILEDVGFTRSAEVEKGVYRMVLNLKPTLVSEEQAASREEKATIASLQAFLKPKSVAVIGASPRPDVLGHRCFTCLLNQRFKGTIYPVNPKGESVASVKGYTSVLDIPGEVDMAVIVVPAKAVQGVVEQCGRKGVRGIIVISAGFGEAGAEGVALQEKLLHTVRSYGMRMVGPNCMGILNTDPAVNMNATFTTLFPPEGKISFATQSGGLGLAILEYAKSLNMGLSTFVSIGNRADVSSNDLLQYWKDDPATEVILLYLESFGNPQKFFRIARAVTGKKPVLVVKSGRTAAGARAAASHTGAMASTEASANALFKQAGIVRVNTLEELFDSAILLETQPVPKGKRVAIITNGGGPGILTADACAAEGLEIPELSDSVKAELRKFLPPEASVHNPIDMTAEAAYEQYLKGLRVLCNADNVDTAIAILVSPVAGRTSEVARAIREVAPEYKAKGKTLLASFMGQRGISDELNANGIRVPSYAFPEASAIAIGKSVEYGDWLRRPAGSIPALANIDKVKAQRIIETARANASGPVWLDSEAINELFGCYGITTTPSYIARSADEAVKLAEKAGFPVVIKIFSKTITHKTDVGGVALDLHSATEVRHAFNTIKANVKKIGKENEMEGVTVQPMITAGVETIVGMTYDPLFGPLIVFGLGGIYTELFKDVSFKIHPLTDIDAKEMVQSVKAYRLLEGWRGSKRHDIPAIEELLLRISAMIEDLPQIRELDLNPVKVQDEGKGYLVVDARISVG